jgi:hypothetical protein
MSPNLRRRKSPNMVIPAPPRNKPRSLGCSADMLVNILTAISNTCLTTYLVKGRSQNVPNCRNVDTSGENCILKFVRLREKLFVLILRYVHRACTYIYTAIYLHIYCHIPIYTAIYLYILPYTYIYTAIYPYILPTITSTKCLQIDTLCYSTRTSLLVYKTNCQQFSTI